MKTIEERAEEHWAVEREKPNGSFKNAIIEALTELSADLNAEKEKELAELKEKLATLAKDYSEVVAGESEMEELTRLREANRKIANESIANQLALQSVCDRKHDALVNARGWILANAKTPIHALMEYTNLIISEKYDSSLLDEVKRVLGAVASCKLFYEESMDIDNHTTDDVNSLLTRLGSHE